MNLERREKRLLEALYDRYGPRDSYPFFEARFVREEGGREYYHVTGTYHDFSQSLIGYDTKHSRNSILELQECGFIVLGDTGEERVKMAITEAGKNAVDHAQ